MTEHATQSWRHKAACLGQEPESWFPLPTRGDPTEAKRVCVSCPVRADCAAHANRRGESAGIWAGFEMPAERDELRVYLGIVPKECTRCGELIEVGNRQTVCYVCTSATRADRVDPEEARAHLIALREKRISFVEMSAWACVNVATLSRIANGRKAAASAEVVRKILALDADEIRGRVSA
jgi:WhiB family transcriptional regulator, redox-sensing transcriptional regulator